jgi:hypothetical protein
VEEKQKPQWEQEWERIMGNAPYIEIKGFFEYQAEVLKLKNPEYCKDSLGKDYDTQYVKLDIIARWLLDWCRRHCARLGHNLENDPKCLASSIHASRKRHADVLQAFVKLASAGFLIPSNDKDSFLTKLKRTKLNLNKESNSNPSETGPKSEPRTGDQNQGQSADAAPVKKHQNLAKALFLLLDSPEQYNNPNTMDKWNEQLYTLVKPDGPYEAEELARAMGWALTKSDFWPKCIYNAENFVNKAEKIINQFRGEKKAKKNAVAAVKDQDPTKAASLKEVYVPRKPSIKF